MVGPNGLEPLISTVSNLDDENRNGKPKLEQKPICDVLRFTGLPGRSPRVRAALFSILQFS